MKTATTSFIESINNGCPYHYIKLYLNNEELEVSFKSFTYYGLINSGDSISIGNACASHVEFELYNQITSLEDKEVQIRVGIEVDGVIEDKSLGYFTVTKPTNIDEVSKYTAYDRMIKLEKLYVSELINPTTISVMNEIGTQLGYGFANELSEIPLDVNKIKGYTYREIVGYISALYGANCVINDEGQIDFKVYTQTDVVIDGNRMYENGLELSSDTTFKVGYIKCATGETVEHTTTDDEGEEITETEDIILSVGNGNTGITFSNPFMTQEILDNIYNTYFINFEYQPCKVNMLGNVLVESGDIVTIDNGTNTYIMPIMSITHSIDGGIITNIEAVAQTESEQSINYEGPLVQMVNRMYHELLSANTILANKIQASNITTDYLQANYVDINKANIDTAWIQDLFVKGKLIAEDITSDEGTFYKLTGVKIYGDIIEANTIRADSLLISGEDGLYYKLNVNSLGETTASADKKYQNGLDGSVIIAESITADKIKVDELLANEIFTHDITATGSISGLALNGCRMNLEESLFFNLDLDKNTFDGYLWCSTEAVSNDDDDWNNPITYLELNINGRLKLTTVEKIKMYGDVEIYGSTTIRDSLSVGGNTVLDTSNYTTYCAKTSHPHAISDITNLQATLDGKAATHSHPYLSTSGGTLSGALTVKGKTHIYYGNLQIGTADIDNEQGLLMCQFNLGTNTASDGKRYYFNNNGTGRFNSLKYASSASYSSRRYKNNIVYKNNDYWHNALMQMKTCTFYYNNDNKTEHLGLIAEDLFELIPELVCLDEEGKPASIEYANLTIPLIGEVQKLNNVVDKQNERISSLEERLAKLETIVEKITV